MSGKKIYFGNFFQGEEDPINQKIFDCFSEDELTFSDNVTSLNELFTNKWDLVIMYKGWMPRLSDLSDASELVYPYDVFSGNIHPILHDESHFPITTQMLAKSVVIIHAMAPYFEKTGVIFEWPDYISSQLNRIEEIGAVEVTKTLSGLTEEQWDSIDVQTKTWIYMQAQCKYAGFYVAETLRNWEIEGEIVNENTHIILIKNEITNYDEIIAEKLSNVYLVDSNQVVETIKRKI